MTDYVWDTGAAVAGSGTVDQPGVANRVDLTSIPAYESNRGGSPIRYYNLGVAGYVVGDAYLPSETLIWPEQLLSPPPANATAIYYRLDPNVVGTLYRGVPMAPELAVAATLTRLTSQSIDSGAWTSISFTSETRDPFGFRSPDTPTIATAPAPGWYQIFGGVVIAANSTGLRGLRVYREGATAVAEQLIPASPSPSTTVLNVAALEYLGVGQTIELQVYQDSGGALAVSATSLSPVLTLVRVGM